VIVGADAGATRFAFTLHANEVTALSRTTSTDPS